VLKPPDKSLQRTVNHKVLGRGRVVSALWRAPRARVLTSQPAAAEFSRYPDDWLWRMAYIYKSAAAAFGAPLWAHALALYEFLEPAEHAYQSEWRVVHPTGVGNLSRDTPERIKNVSPPQGWAKFLHVLPVQPEDVLGFVCPAQEREQLAKRLPEIYRGKLVSPHDG
jgi:hypothetical protein